MTRAEAIEALSIAKHVAPSWISAGMFEDAELFLLRPVLIRHIREYARRVLPAGRRGRVALVLPPPPVARARALCFGILRSIEEENGDDSE